MLEDLIPRVDLISHLSAETLTQLADRQWKVKSEGLTALTAALRNTRVTTNLGDIPTLLKALLKDANRNAATQALNISAMLATALGNQAKSVLPNLLQEIVACLADQKVCVYV